MKINPRELGYQGAFHSLLLSKQKNLLKPHFVFLSVLTGTTPESVASCSSFMNVEKCSRLGLREGLVIEPAQSGLWLVLGCGSFRGASSSRSSLTSRSWA
jgi:hypothetical protein